MKIAIVRYGMGNIGSVEKAIKKIGHQPVVTSDKVDIENTDFIILPGVGSFQAAMENLKRYNLDQILKEEVLVKKKPIIGICLGMQLFATLGHEEGLCEGLGFIEGEVVKIKTTNLPVPHMGWNDIKVKENVFFNNIKDFNFYFVHSYFFNVSEKEECVATVEYGSDIAAIVQKENIFGTQFHPEKSQESGLILLKNFLNNYA